MPVIEKPRYDEVLNDLQSWLESQGVQNRSAVDVLGALYDPSNVAFDMGQPFPMMTGGQYMDKLRYLSRLPEAEYMKTFQPAMKIKELLDIPSDAALSRLHDIALDTTRDSSGYITSRKSTINNMANFERMVEAHYKKNLLTPAGAGSDVEYIIGLNPERGLRENVMSHEGLHLSQFADPNFEHPMYQYAQEMFGAEPGRRRDDLARYLANQPPLTHEQYRKLGEALHHYDIYYGRPDEFVAEVGSLYDYLRSHDPLYGFSEFAEGLKRQATKEMDSRRLKAELERINKLMIENLKRGAP